MFFLKARTYKLEAAFTLIELLVVIAIISLLSSIVLASLGQARAKAADAAIKADLTGVRNSAEIAYQDKKCYDAGEGFANCTLDTYPPPASPSDFGCIKEYCLSGGFTGDPDESIFRNPDVQRAIETAVTVAGGTVYYPGASCQYVNTCQGGGNGGSCSFNPPRFSNSSCIQAVNGGAWAVAVQYKSDPSRSWCVDSTGASRQVTPTGGDHGFSGFACRAN